MKRKAAFVLAALMVLCSMAAVSAEEGTASRIIVYQETFEDGTGLFAANGAEAVLDWEEDGSGNHYVVIRLNPEKIESVATYTRTPGGRWGTEFYTWPIQLNDSSFVLKNGKNYQFKFDGSYHNGTAFGKPSWGTGVLHMGAKSIWTTQDAAEAVVEVFATPLTGTEIAGKSGWYDCYSAENWLTNYKFGTTRTGDAESGYQFSGDAKLSYYHVRTNLATAVAQIMADGKYYCGKGTGLTNASGVPQSGAPWGGYYKFTLTRDDFYGDEAIFNGVTDQAEIDKIKDSYIYEEDGTTLKQYSLGHDCSFLKSDKRIAAFKEYMAGYQVGYAMDNFRIVADAYEYTDTVSITGQGTVSAVTNPVTNEVTVVNSGDLENTVVTNDYFGVVYTVTPAEGYLVDSVTYGGTNMVLNDDGSFAIDADAVTEDKALNVTFVLDEAKAPEIQRVAAVDTDRTYDDNGTLKPAAVLYVQVSAGTDGSNLQKTGAMLRDNVEGHNSLELIARNADGTEFNQEGAFGILVFGDGFQGGTYFFKPFVTYQDSQGDSHTLYAQEEESFTLGSAE